MSAEPAGHADAAVQRSDADHPNAWPVRRGQEALQPRAAVVVAVADLLRAELVRVLVLDQPHGAALGARLAAEGGVGAFVQVPGGERTVETAAQSGGAQPQ